MNNKRKRTKNNIVDFLSYAGIFIFLGLFYISSLFDSRIPHLVFEIVGYIMVFFTSFSICNKIFLKFTSGHLDVIVDKNGEVVGIKKLTMNIPVEELTQYHDIPIRINMIKEE